MIGFVASAWLSVLSAAPQDPASSTAAPQSATVPWISAIGDGSRVAALVYSNGLSLSVVCRDAQLVVLIGGLTAVATPTRTLQVNLHSEALRDSLWAVGSDGTTAISLVPGVYARAFRSEGQFTARVPSIDGAPARRYVLTLPADSSPLDAVLEDCDVPLERESDLAFDPSIPPVMWEVLPRPIWPESSGVVNGTVVLTCLAQPDGSVDGCEIESEQPRVDGFGRAALLGLRSARIRVLPGTPSEPRSFTFTMRFNQLGSTQRGGSFRRVF